MQYTLLTYQDFFKKGQFSFLNYLFYYFIMAGCIVLPKFNNLVVLDFFKSCDKFHSKTVS